MANVIIDFIVFLLQCMYLFLPAVAAVLIPKISKSWFVSIARPINKKLFGKEITWRDLVFVFIFAVLVVFIQKQLFLDYFVMEQFSLINYEFVNIWWFGLLFCLGVFLGNLVGSFLVLTYKMSKIFIKSIDWILGGLLFTLFYVNYTWKMMLAILVIFFLISLKLNYLKAVFLKK